MPDAQRINVLVTGGAGFIGSHLCDELVKSANVICIDNFITSNVKNISHLLEYPNFRFINHDITQPIDLEALTELEDFNIKYKGLDQVYHLACPTSVKRFEELMIETAQANSIGTKNVLDVALKYKAPILFTSSAVVYGSSDKPGEYFKEEHKGIVNFLTPRANYDEGKRFAETLVYSYHLKYQLPTRIARVFRTYGPRMLLNDNQVVSDYILQALDGRDIIVHGDERFETALCYVSDVVEGLIKTMFSEEPEVVVNVGSDTPFLLTEVAQKIIDLTESSSKITFEDPVLFVTQLGLPDLTRMKQDFGWLPVVALDSGLKQTIDYIKAERGVMQLQ